MKYWLESRTLRVNLIAAMLMALEASLGILKPYIGESFWVIMAVSLPIINAGLRVITKQAITFKQQ